MNWKTITVIFCISMGAIAIGYDVLADREGGVTATISRVVWNSAHEYPLIPLLVGILLGHLFWSQSGQ